MSEARAELDAAVNKWLKVKASEVDDEEDDLVATNDPIILGWQLTAVYTSLELERDELTATAYEVAEHQPAPYSRGIAMMAVDRYAG